MAAAMCFAFSRVAYREIIKLTSRAVGQHCRIENYYSEGERWICSMLSKVSCICVSRRANNITRLYWNSLYDSTFFFNTHVFKFNASAMRFSHAHHVWCKLFAVYLVNSTPWAVTLRGIRPGGNVRGAFFGGNVRV